MNEHDDLAALEAEWVANQQAATPRRPDADELAADTARAAAAEPDAPTVALVVCARCSGNQANLGTVRRTSRGLLFESTAANPTARRYDRDHERQVRRQTGWRHGDAMGADVVQILLDDDVEMAGDWPPRATCPAHGQDMIGVDRIHYAIRSTHRPPAVITIHHGD